MLQNMNDDTVNETSFSVKIIDSISHIHEMFYDEPDNIQDIVLYWNGRHEDCFPISTDFLTQNHFFHKLTNHLIKILNPDIQAALEDLLYDFDDVNSELTNHYNQLLHKRYDDFMETHSKRHKNSH